MSVAPGPMRDVRAPNLRWALALLAVVVCAGILYLTAYKSFFLDEWAFVTTRREWTWDIFFLSHNSHWSTLFILVWKILFVVFGIRSHLPYQGAVLPVHVAAVFLLFALIRRRSGDLPAFAAAVIFLVLGSGGENITWAFQIAWDGSVAFGLLAMLLLDGREPSRWRMAAASAALLGSLMCSNVGVAFLAATGIELVMDRGRWHALPVLVAPAAAFAAWFLVYDTGHFAAAPGAAGQVGNGPAGFAYLTSLAAFIAYGLEASAAGVFGAPAAWGLTMLGLAGGLVAVDLYVRKRLESWQIGLAGGVVVWFVLVGLGRLEFGAEYAGQGRYVYVGAAFMLPLIADAVANFPWRRLYRPALVAAFALSVFGNAVELRNVALDQVDLMQTQTAELQTVEAFRGAPDLGMHAPIDNWLMPTIEPGAYFSAIDSLGSPVRPATLDSLGHSHPDAVDRVMVNLFGPALSVGPNSGLSTDGLACRDLDSADLLTLDLRVHDTEPVMMQFTKGGEAALFLSYFDPPSATPVRRAELAAGVQEWIHVPDTGKHITWRLRIATASTGVVRECGGELDQVQNPAGGTYTANAAAGSLDPGWSAVADPAAIDGSAARAAAGVYSNYRNDVFMNPVVPVAGSYDVWYRVRVASPASSTPEMTVGLWDDQRVTWVANSEYAPSAIGGTYRWVKAVSAETPPAGDSVQFIASFTNSIATDWFVDRAVMLPAGSPAPTG